MAVSYQHDQLPEGRFIRILYLHPTKEPKDPLKCSLVSCALSEGQSPACEYEALSYVWGSPVGHLPLEVGDNAETLLITKNCETALWHLRLREQKRALWVDSICIDQGSISEKDHQLKLMGEIYRQASSVRVWVG
ncbi:heterokaryon incompatibility protein-domain-containing protein, partial [Bisporella sp. PMI_857]